MKLFRSSAEKELDRIVAELEQYLANNYKDQAHLMRERLGTRATELRDEGRLKPALYEQYEKLYLEYTEKMKNYNHREFYKS